MDYRFNYRMLADWLDANPQFTKTQVARTLGFTDQAAMVRWVAGDKAMPTEHLLRFCNSFQVPLGAFFFDNDAIADLHLSAPHINSQTEPNGGYKAKNKKGGAHFPSPVPTRIIRSNMPSGITAEQEDSAEDVTEQEEVRKEDAAVTQTPSEPAQTMDITQIFIAYQQALERMQKEHQKREDNIRASYENKWAKERDEMLETIRLQRLEISEMKKRNMRYGMVGEDLSL